jgi:hypothetical protein
VAIVGPTVSSGAMGVPPRPRVDNRWSWWGGAGTEWRRRRDRGDTRTGKHKDEHSE